MDGRVSFRLDNYNWNWLRMIKTLLVEDNLIYRSVLKRALRKKFIGIEIKEASCDTEVLSAINTYEPDLVIMDIDLNCEINGLELTKIIKGKYLGAVVIILSQHDIPEYRSVSKQYGADGFLSKNSSLKNIFDYLAPILEPVPL